MEKNYRIISTILVLILFVGLLFFIENSKRGSPEVVLIRVLDKNKLPISNANCNADISSSLMYIRDRSLNEIPNIYDYILGIHVSGENSEKGFLSDLYASVSDVFLCT